MSSITKFKNLKDLLVELRGQSVLLDSNVAELYEIETKRINEHPRSPLAGLYRKVTCLCGANDFIYFRLSYLEVVDFQGLDFSLTFR